MHPVLADRYELQELLATGGMGQVWRARDLRLHRPVAVKLLRSEYTGDATFLARFRAEAQLTARLLHRNIAALHDYGEVQGPQGETCAFLVMELVEGESLATLLARERRLPAERVLDLVEQTAAALAAAHAAGVVHRDVKPGNVLVGRDGVVKITDFGIAWSASSVPLTQTGQVVGTAHYLSPEQAGGGKASPASDVYALGMVAYECLAGRRAFDGESPVQVALQQLRDTPDPLPDDVPEPVRRLIAHALAKDPAERYADGVALRAAAADVRAGGCPEPVVAPRTARMLLPGGLDAGRRPARRRATRLLVPVATLLTGVGIGVGVGVLQLTGAAESPPAAAAAEETAGGIRVVPADLVGRPVDEVEAELAGLGLAVERAPVADGAVAPGTVTGVTPVGELRVGDRVTVSFAVAPDEPAPVTPEGGTSSVDTLTVEPVSPSSGSPVPAPVPVPAPEPVVTPQDTGGAPSGGDGSGSGSAGGGSNGNGVPGSGAANGNGGGNGNGAGNGNGNGNGAANGNGRPGRG
ncbi:serine/threonine protein kinase [Blastococcus sp. SYSU D00820]